LGKDSDLARLHAMSETPRFVRGVFFSAQQSADEGA
jgi:hypothetical protein